MTSETAAQNHPSRLLRASVLLGAGTGASLLYAFPRVLAGQLTGPAAVGLVTGSDVSLVPCGAHTRPSRKCPRTVLWTMFHRVDPMVLFLSH